MTNPVSEWLRRGQRWFYGDKYTEVGETIPRNVSVGGQGQVVRGVTCVAK